MNAFLSEPSARQLKTLVASPALSDRSHVPVESLDFDEAVRTPPHAEDVTGRLEAALTSSLEQGGTEEQTDAREFRQAMTLLLQLTRDTARKLDDDPLAPLTTDDAMALEAVIRADGTRPSLPVHDGAVDPRHPLAGSWSDLLESTRSALSDVVRAVGRVEPEYPTVRDYFGTAWVVDRGAGLALTNLHVVEAMWRRVPHHMERTEQGLRVRAGVFVDFVGEFGGQKRNRFRVVDVIVPPAADGPGFLRLDAAVLRLEPIQGNETDLPPAIGISTGLNGPQGGLSSFCLVGFPGPPRYFGGRHEGVDWTWVHTTLFGHQYGIKRLAPGLTHRPLGSVDGDERQWVFGHDLTTLGGSSGSPVLDWLAPTPSGFGLHFAGATLDSNYAHALGACTAELEALGVRAD